MIKGSALIKSFQYALRGLRYAWVHEQNFRIQIGVGCLVIGGALLMGISWAEWAILTLAISTTYILELVNTVIEHIMDALSPRIDPYASHVKDIMASAVLLASLAAVIIGLTIILPRIMP